MHLRGTGDVWQLTVHVGAALPELTERALRYGLSMVKKAGGGLRPHVQPANSYEKRLLPEVVHPDDAGIGFSEASSQSIPLPALSPASRDITLPNDMPVTLRRRSVAGDTGVLWGFPGLRLVTCTAGTMTQHSVTADAREQVGALGKAKMVLREVVQLPLQQPALFARGSLARPTKGILLFGPPGASRPPACLACTAHMDSITLLCLTGTYTLRCPKSGV